MTQDFILEVWVRTSTAWNETKNSTFAILPQVKMKSPFISTAIDMTSNGEWSYTVSYNFYQDSNCSLANVSNIVNCTMPNITNYTLCPNVTVTNQTDCSYWNITSNQASFICTASDISCDATNDTCSYTCSSGDFQNIVYTCTVNSSDGEVEFATCDNSSIALPNNDFILNFTFDLSTDLPSNWVYNYQLNITTQ